MRQVKPNNETINFIITFVFKYFEKTLSYVEKSLVVNIDQRNASIGVGYGENIHAQNIGASNYSIK